MIDTHVADHSKAELCDLRILLLQVNLDGLIVQDLDELSNGLLVQQWLDSSITESQIDESEEEGDEVLAILIGD